MSEQAQNPWFKRKLKGIITPSREKKETPLYPKSYLLYFTKSCLHFQKQVKICLDFLTYHARKIIQFSLSKFSIF